MPEILPATVTHIADDDGLSVTDAFFYIPNAQNEVQAGPENVRVGGITWENLPSARIFSATLRVTMFSDPFENPVLPLGDNPVIFSVETDVARDPESLHTRLLDPDVPERQKLSSRANAVRFDSRFNNGVEQGNLPWEMHGSPSGTSKTTGRTAEVGRISQSLMPSTEATAAQFDIPLSLPPLFSAFQRGTAGRLNMVVTVEDVETPFGVTTIRDIEHGFAAELIVSQLVTDDGDSISFRRRGHRWFVCIRCGHEYPIDRAVRDAEQRTLFVCDTGCQDELGRRDTVLLRRERQDRLWPRI